MSNICHQYALRGSCRKGEGCKFLHQRREGTPALAPPARRTRNINFPPPPVPYTPSGGQPASAGDHCRFCDSDDLRMKISELKEEIENARKAQLEAEDDAEYRVDVAVHAQKSAEIRAKDAERKEAVAIKARNTAESRAKDAERREQEAIKAQNAAESRAKDAERRLKEVRKAQNAAEGRAKDTEGREQEAIKAQNAAESRAKDAERRLKEARKSQNAVAMKEAELAALRALEDAERAKLGQMEAEWRVLQAVEETKNANRAQGLAEQKAQQEAKKAKKAEHRILLTIEQSEKAKQAKAEAETRAKIAEEKAASAHQAMLLVNQDADKAREAQPEAERKESQALAEAEPGARLEADGATESVTRAPSLAQDDAGSCCSPPGQTNDPPPYSQDDQAASVDPRLEVVRQKAAADEYAVTMQRIVLGSTLASFGPGLVVQSFICGFDNGLIELENVPLQATKNDIGALFTGINARFCVVDIRQYEEDKVSATVAVREDIKQRVVDAVSGQSIRGHILIARALKTTVGYAAPRHYKLSATWRGWGSPPQNFGDNWKQRLASIPGFVSFESECSPIPISGTSLGPGGSCSVEVTARFNSWTSAHQACDFLNSKQAGPDYPVLQWNLEPKMPISHALVVPLEQYYLHESGDTSKYGETSIVPETAGLTVTTKDLGFGWFSGWEWFDDEHSKTFFGRDLRRQIPGITMTKWDCTTKALTIYANSEAAVTQASNLMDSFATESTLALFSERIDRRFVKPLMQSAWLKMTMEKLGEDKLSLEVFRSQYVLAYRGLSAFFAARRVMEEIETGELPADDDDPKSTCPVCLCESSGSVTLVCGHEYCISCLKSCVLTAQEQNRLPIVCIGDSDTCQRPIAIPIIQSLFSPLELQRLIERVAQAYINGRSGQYHSCITPDCTQVYYCSKGRKYITCSSCSVTLCSACHSKAHSSLSCADWRILNNPAEYERTTSQGPEDLGTRACPGCEVLYLKEGGCNRAYCGVCKIHFCWVCLAAFKDATEVYQHLGAVHGSIDNDANQQDLQLAQRLQAQELAETGSDANASDSKASYPVM